MFCLNNNRLLLQFHITGRCNLRCKHCYRTEGDIEPLSLEDIKEVIDQFTVLCAAYNVRHGLKKRGHINLTGGEPFCRADIRDILTYLGEHNKQLTYGVLSNGSFLDDSLLALLLDTGASFVQLSIDGDRAAHDTLRAPGDYDLVFRSAEWLEKRGVRTYISFTANRENYRLLPKVAAECRRRHITKLWSDRLVPIGHGEALASLAITTRELPDYLRALRRARGSRLVRRLYPGTQVTMNRALQFLDPAGSPYTCAAGISLITVDEHGQILPCRRMPIVCGDVFTSTLEQVYFGNPVFRELQADRLPPECVACDRHFLCQGGARCQSYAAYGNFHQADPACPLSTRGDEKPPDETRKISR